MVKAIETFYKGYRFRSRLEARWAVYLDMIGAKYEYEPEGYDLGDGTYYLPDFKIYAGKNAGGRTPEVFFLEVKGVPTPEDDQKVKKLSMKFPVLMVGRIYEGSKDIYTMFSSMDGIYETVNGCAMNSFEYVDGDCYPCILGASTSGGIGLYGPDWYYSGRDPMDEEKTLSAALGAKQARFEHGETPRVFNVGNIINFEGLKKYDGQMFGIFGTLDAYTDAKTGFILDIQEKRSGGHTATIILSDFTRRRLSIEKMESFKKDLKIIGDVDIEYMRRRLFEGR